MHTASQSLPPGPRSWIPGRVFKDLRRDPLDFLTRLAKTYGDISTFTALGQRYVIINSPDLAREILLTQADAFWKGPALQNSKGILGNALLTAEGDDHRQQRRLMQSAFHAKHVETYAPDVLSATQDLLQNWQAAGPQTVRDIRPDLMGLTLVIAGETLFGAMLSDDIATVHRCMDDLMNNYRRAVVPWGKLLNWIPTPTTLKLARAQRDMRNLVHRMIAARRAELAAATHTGAAHRHDLLTMMISATDSETTGDTPTTGSNGGSGRCPFPHKTARFSDDQLRDQCITILTAAHETTANAMTFTLYLLARHPAEQTRLRAEANAVLAGAPHTTVEMLDHLPHTRNVLSESMRLLPPAWTLGRQNQRPLDLAGFHIPAKCTILLPQWTLHRDPRFFPDPLAFTPDRWKNPIHPRYAYLPFSTGPRNCIGESFAWLEMMLALPMLIRACTFAPVDNSPLRLTPAITLRPRNPVILQINRMP